MGGTVVGQLQQMLDLLIDFPFLDSTGHWSCTLGGYDHFTIAEFRICRRFHFTEWYFFYQVD